MPGSVQLNGFYSRQALRCRLMARRSSGSQAAAIISLAEEYERAAAELRSGWPVQAARSNGSISPDR